MGIRGQLRNETNVPRFLNYVYHVERLNLVRNETLRKDIYVSL
jgi:hypothetical protein